MLIDLAPPNPPLKNIDGILLFFDNTRSKWLSSSSSQITFGLKQKNISSNRYMTMTGGIYSNNSGHRILKDATILSMSVQTSNLTDCSFHIRKNDNVSNISTIVLSSQIGNIIDNINVDINKNDFLQCYLETNSNSLNYPELILEYSWRG